MRAGPLSHAKVISLLNSYFVPVFISNEDYDDKGTAPPAEKTERSRIFQEAAKAHLSVGTVHVYVLTSDGHPFDSLHIATATKTERLVELLERTIQRLKVAPGKPLIKPIPQSVAPKSKPGSLILHLTARSLDGRGSWGEFPVENWLLLERAQWTKFLPAGEAEVGSSWDIEPDVAARLLKYFYPATENNDPAKNRIQQQSLKATMVSLTGGRGGVARARLQGSLKMKHSFYHRDDDKVVEATFVGFVDFEPGKRRIRSLRMVTDKATYNGGTFGVAVRSVP